MPKLSIKKTVATEINKTKLSCVNSDLLADSHGRSVRYVRISLTDRCNFKCIYCSSDELRQNFIPHNNILRYEEILSVASILEKRGIEKIRLTGGEPFMRKGLMKFIEQLRMQQPNLLISLTTNGSLLRPHLQGLKDLGVTGINISLDSLNPTRFETITGSKSFHEVMKSIESAIDMGIAIKLNAVALRKHNQTELKDFINFATVNPVEVRFIEFMPMGGNEPWLDLNVWPAESILKEARNFAELVPLETKDPKSGPAKIFQIKGGLGRFGLITPLSNHFCNQCNRLRITADGRLRTCLFSEKEYHFRELLRHPKLGLKYVERLFNKATYNKPIGFDLLEARKTGIVNGRKMGAIGG